MANVNDGEVISQTRTDKCCVKEGDNSDHVKDVIRVVPDRAVFSESKTSLNISISNSSKTSHHIRLIRPLSPYFTLVNHDAISVRLAPGLKFTVKLRLNVSNLRSGDRSLESDTKTGSNQVNSEDIFDRFIVQSEIGETTIPIKFERNRGDIRLESAIDLGITNIGNTATYVLKLRNQGTAEAEFTVLDDEAEAEDDIKVTVIPRSGKVKARSISHVRLEVLATSTGVFNRILSFRLNDRMHRVELCGEFVESRLEIIDTTLKTSSKAIDFGKAYFGVNLEQIRTLVNSSPNTCTFRVATQEQQDPPGGSGGSENNTIELLNATGSGMDPPAISVSPQEGVLGPYSSISVRFRFRPRQGELKTGFKSQIPGGTVNLYHIMVQFVAVGDIERSVSIHIRGVAAAPFFSFSHDSLNLGQCPVNERRDAIIKLENHCDDLGLPFTIKDVPHFHSYPKMGNIPALQSRDIIISFVPRQLGAFENILQFELGGEQKFEFRVSGSSPSISKPEKNTSSDKRTQRERGLRRNFIESVLCEERDGDLTSGAVKIATLANPSSSLVLSPEKANRLYYAQFLHEQEQRRHRQPPEDPEHFESGLIEPILELPKTQDPLWLQYPMAGYPSSGGKQASMMRPQGGCIPDGRAKGDARKKFKSVPSTQAEVQDCAAKLSARQLAKISCGPAVLAFGTVCTSSKTFRTFMVANGLEKYIHLRLCPDPSGPLSETKLLEQVIPPGLATSFTICLNPHHVQDLRVVVPYVINGSHNLNFTVTAQVTPIEISLSTPTIQFTFPRDSLEFATARRLILSNPCMAPAQFKWIVPDPTLTFIPANGVIPPHKDLDMQIVGGVDQYVMCTSDIVPVNCTLSSSSIDLGLVAVGNHANSTVMLNNIGQSYAVFNISQCPANLIVTPNKGKLSPSQSLPLKVQLRLPSAATFSGTFSVDIRGSTSLSVSVCCEAVLPSVSIVQGELDFGSVTIGSRSTIDIGVRSTSTVVTTLYLDLTTPQYDDFCVVFSNKSAKSVSVTPISKLELKNATDNGNQIVQDNDGDHDKGPRAFRLDLSPGSLINLPLTYIPSSVNQHTVPLPLVLAGFPTYPDIRRLVHAQGLKPKIVLSSTNISFGQRIVLKSSKALLGAYITTFTITNDDLSSTAWAIDVDSEHGDANKNPFKIEPFSGVLGQKETTIIKVCFSPTERGGFETMYNLFIGSNRDDPYMNLSVKGSAEHPMLKFDALEVTLPAVPLGIKSEVRFLISNSGYDRTSIEYQLPLDTAQIPLQIDFPSGVHLGSKSDSIPVVLSFIASKPTSFATTVDFIVDDGNRFSLPVHGLADNSILSVWPFLSLRRYSIQFGEGHGITCVDLGLRSPPAGSSTAGLTNIDNIRPASEIASAAANTLRFLASLNMIEVSGHAFPTDLVASNGEPILRLVEFLSGSTVFKSELHALSLVPSKSDTTPAVLNLYEKLLSYLRAHGAVLTVKAEHLGPLSAMVSALPIGSWERQTAEKLAPSVSRQAWFNVLSQIIKIFLLERVTTKSVCEAIGCSTFPTCIPSNLYSSHETLLLAWLTHYRKDRSVPVTNFENDLRDGTVLGNLLFAHLPYLKQLSNLDESPDDDQERMTSNAQKIISSMEEAGLDYQVSASFIVSPNPRDMLLLVLYLFTVLPGYLPRSTVEFTGAVHENITKTVTLKNPFASEVIYDVRFDGCADFHASSKSIMLSGRGSELFQIAFCGRFARNDSAVLRLIPSRQLRTRPPSMLSQPVVFSLVSSVSESLTPQATLTTRSNLYEATTFVMELRNTLDKDCTFSIDCSHQLAKIIPNRHTAKMAPAVDKPSSGVFPNAFSTEKKTISVKTGATEKLSCSFQPTLEAEYSCTIKFVDSEVGELRIDVRGEVNLPNPIGETIKVTCKENTPVVKDILLSLVNPNLEKAMMRIDGERKSKGGVSSVINPLRGPLAYSVDCSSPFITVSKTCILTDRVLGLAPAGSSNKTINQKLEGLDPSKQELNQPGDNVLRLVFKGGQPGLYPAEITLRSEHDIRIYHVEFASQSEGMKAHLEFDVAAGQTLRQNIPIVNSSDNEWRITAELKGSGWSGPSSIAVPRNSTGAYPLSFSPLWICESEGLLLLVNTNTKESYSYTLKGQGRDPLPIKVVTINCNAREKFEQLFTVENRSNEDCVYRVESDLPYIHGDSTISVPSRSKKDYKLLMSPQMSGVYNGSITFICKDERYQWFAVEATIGRPLPESTLKIECPLREAVTADLVVQNPLDKKISFDVSVEGDYLFCDNQVQLDPCCSATFVLSYVPLKVGQSLGRVRFFNNIVGEFWYNLDLKCEIPEPMRLDPLICEAGSQAVHEVTLTNPSQSRISIVSVSSEPKNFTVRPSTFQLNPGQSCLVHIIYTPSVLNEVQNGIITFQENQIGDWVYIVSGIGKPPTAMQPIHLLSSLGQRSSSIIQFRNPFDRALIVRISLHQRGHDAFRLYSRRELTRITGQTQLQVPFVFVPTALSCYNAEVVIEASEGLRWVYPLMGEAELLSSEPLNFLCISRQPLTKTLTLILPGLTQSEIDNNDFTIKVEHVTTEPSGVPLEILSDVIQAKEQTDKPVIFDNGAGFVFEVNFRPFRTLHVESLLSITKSSGGRYSFRMRFTSTEAAVDDVVRISAGLNQIANVSFRLSNIINGKSQFEAHFAPDSPYQLSVQPTKGFLEGRDSLGTLFTISFAPSEYGKAIVGKLVICTDAMEWIYEVRGSHPHYLPPKGRNTFSSFMDETTMRSIQNSNNTATNYLNYNIRATSSRRRQDQVQKKKPK